MSILVETPLATGSKHFCSMEHLVQFVLRLRQGGSPLYEVLHERERESGRARLTLKGILERIEQLEGMVVEAVKRKAELEEKVKALEEEKAALLAEIEALKALPELEAKVGSLEAEVAKLREEKKALEEKPILTVTESVSALADTTAKQDLEAKPASPPAESPPPAEDKPPT